MPQPIDISAHSLPHPLARMPEEWVQAVQASGGRAFHGRQIFRWIHKRGVTDPAAMSDLPLAVRTAIAEQGVSAALAVVNEHRSLDNTRKIVACTHDGYSIETVLIPSLGKIKAHGELPETDDADAAAAADDDEDDAVDSRATRVTQCISTQVGCAMGCVFCASGAAGIKRNLGPEEIVAQVLEGRAKLESTEALRNVVLMGMGEPLHNYDATVRALRLLTHPDGIGLSPRRVTVSTSGLVPEIARLGEDFAGNIGLAISLHATDDETRSRLMPINRKYPLATLMAALRAYPLPRRRRITIEYTLVAGKNDSVTEAKKLLQLLEGLPVKINLIPMNPITASSLGPPDLSGVLAFQRVLLQAGHSCFIRRRRGDDVSAACGQLALLGAKPKVKGFRTAVESST